MTTPASPGPSITLATDKPSYNVGDELILTVTYADAVSKPVELSITAKATDAGGNTVENTISITVTEQASGQMDVTVSDSFGNAYVLVSNDGHSQAVLKTTVGAPPA